MKAEGCFNLSCRPHPVGAGLMPAQGGFETRPYEPVVKKFSLAMVSAPLTGMVWEGFTRPNGKGTSPL